MNPHNNKHKRASQFQAVLAQVRTNKIIHNKSNPITSTPTRQVPPESENIEVTPRNRNIYSQIDNAYTNMPPIPC